MRKIAYHLSVFGLLYLLMGTGLALVTNSCAPSGEVTAYAAPEWAPPYEDVADVPYYYFPDYGFYYDVGASQYWYPENGVWLSSGTLPDRFHDVDLNRSYMVMLNKGASKPWTNHSYYSQNYPAHAHENYTNIVTSNRAIPNVAPDREIIPRAYNENTDRVTFAEHPRNTPAAPAIAHHEVPMQTIAPSMPPASRPYNYGSGYKHR